MFASFLNSSHCVILGYFGVYFYIFFKCLHDFPLTVLQALDDSRYGLFVLILITCYFTVVLPI